MRKALTVGELLVTMAIIGVIAMLVLPSFMKDYHNKLYTVRLKKVYEMLTDAMERACTDNNVSHFNQTTYAKPNNAASQKAFLETYFKVSKKNGEAAFADKYRKLSTNDNEGSSISSYILGGKTKLQGGESISITCESSTECVVLVDINSTDGPNIGGRDLFRFRIDTSTNTVMSHSGAGECGNDNVGHGCFSRIIQDNWTMKY